MLPTNILMVILSLSIPLIFDVFCFLGFFFDMDCCGLVCVVVHLLCLVWICFVAFCFRFPNALEVFPTVTEDMKLLSFFLQGPDAGHIRKDILQSLPE